MHGGLMLTGRSRCRRHVSSPQNGTEKHREFSYKEVRTSLFDSGMKPETSHSSMNQDLAGTLANTKKNAGSCPERDSAHHPNASPITIPKFQPLVDEDVSVKTPAPFVPMDVFYRRRPNRFESAPSSAQLPTNPVAVAAHTVRGDELHSFDSGDATRGANPGEKLMAVRSLDSVTKWCPHSPFNAHIETPRILWTSLV